MSQHADRLPSNHTAQAPVQVGSRSDRDTTNVLRQTSISRSNRSAIVVPTSHRRPIPSPLQTTQSYRTVSSPSLKSPTEFSPRGTRFPVTPLDHHQTSFNPGDKPSPSIGRTRAATIEQARGPDEAFDEIKAVAARDALLDEVARSRLQNRKRPFATPIHSPDAAAAAAVVDSNLWPASASTSASTRRMAAPSHSSQSAHSDVSLVAHRTASIDSTASSLSSSTSQTFKQAQLTAQENVTPQDIATLVQTAGSPEAAILKLLQEKQSVANHTDQMWRIMEKQRAMIFGLKSDLERALKDKDKYRKRLKEQLALSAAGQSLATALKQSTTSARADSQSPTATTTSNGTSAIPDGVVNSRKASDATDLSALNDVASRSSTPQQAPPSPNTAAYSPVESISSKLPHAPLSASSLHQVTMPESRMSTNASRRAAYPPGAPQSPRTPQDDARADPLANIKLMTSPQSFSSPKDRSNPLARKPPPAPLNLSPQSSPRPQVAIDAAQVSESEYEDDGSEDDGRGRQKTRADDDRQREREAFAMQEQTSNSTKERKSKSKSAPPPLGHTPVLDMHSTDIKPASPQILHSQTMGSMISHLRTVSDADAAPPAIYTTLMSPGLPMSPRPGDRPMNSPMPRAPKQLLAGIPMSPRDGGMSLSPRAPRGPIPLPTPSAMSSVSSSSARAEAYQLLNGPSGGGRLAVPAHPSPEAEQPLHNTAATSPGEIYRGLLSDQHPGLLLPPNALPSIFIKVDSSRLRPARNSYMGPRQSEENPVFTLAIFARSNDAQLWRVEKTLAALSVFDQQLKASSDFKARLPDRALFTGHAPARIDARRVALGAYFDNLLDTPINDQAATIVCGFLTADAFPAEATDYFPRPQEPTQPVMSPMPTGLTRKDGYLTKRGKNFGGWKARYFVLDGPQLKYFEAPGGALLGSIKLPYAQIGKQSTAPQNDEDIDNQYRHAFLILEPKRKDSAAHMRHVLCAESDEERDAWVACLLQYVDDDQGAKKASHTLQTSNEPTASGRSPRLQKSMNDIGGPASSGRGSSTQASLRSVPYQTTVAAEAPVMGNASVKGRDTPSPVVGSPISNDYDDDKSHNHPLISGPTNGTVIQDVQSWGNKPTVQTPVKDKKRSIFGFGVGGGNRGRASSDTATSVQQTVRPVFGVPLVEAVEFSAPADVAVLLPAVAYRCIEYLRARGATSEEGIFRLSGSNLVIKALRERFNTEGDINLLTDEQHYDINAVASLLKQYLRELPANILTRDLQFDFLSAQEQLENVKVDLCNVLVNRLPPPNRELLEAVSAFLREIVDNEKVNKMSVRNGTLIALVFLYRSWLTFVM